jgi:hypothetical protein
MSTLTLKDMTMCLEQYLKSLDIEKKYIHIEYNQGDSRYSPSYSLLLPIHGIEVDPDVHSLLYGHKKRSNQLPFIELLDINNKKLTNEEIRTVDNMTAFLKQALRLGTTITLQRKVDHALDQLDEILKLINTPPPVPQAPRPQPAPHQKITHWKWPWGK